MHVSRRTGEEFTVLDTIKGTGAFAAIVAIERIERDAWLDIYTAAPPDLRV